VEILYSPAERGRTEVENKGAMMWLMWNYRCQENREWWKWFYLPGKC
jgi:hypothetical protein